MSKSSDFMVFIDEHYPARWVDGVEEITKEMYDAYWKSLGTEPEPAIEEDT